MAVIATGLAAAIQHRKKVRIGWLTPLLALFVGLDIASFWDFAWNVFRDIPFSYGLLVAGLVIALTYFVAASWSSLTRSRTACRWTITSGLTRPWCCCSLPPPTFWRC